MFEVIVNGVAVASLESGKSFGELALLYNTPRAATVYALTNCVVYALDRDTFRNTLANTSFSKVRGTVCLSLLAYLCLTFALPLSNICFALTFFLAMHCLTLIDNSYLQYRVSISHEALLCLLYLVIHRFTYFFIHYCHLHS